MAHETTLSPQSRLLLIHLNRLLYLLRDLTTAKYRELYYIVMCYEPGKKNSKSFQTPKQCIRC